jgi:hypothetical protein
MAFEVQQRTRKDVHAKCSDLDRSSGGGIISGRNIPFGERREERDSHVLTEQLFLLREKRECVVERRTEGGEELFKYLTNAKCWNIQ